MSIIVVNAGSSSLKLSEIDADGRRSAEHSVDRWESGDPRSIEPFVGGRTDIEAVVHRVVHGGEQYSAATLIDDDVVAGIEALAALAPLHQRRALAAIEATRSVLAGVPEVACFDTAFHSTIPEAHRIYALPEEWRKEWPLRKFGFHGLSHSYVAKRAPLVARRPVQGTRTVSCHLGSGASVCAIRDGKSVDTTMGFTPVDGLIMGTRSGSVDPGLIVWLIQQGLSVDDVSSGLEHRSGLAALSGTSGDMRDVLGLVEGGVQRARLALDAYVSRLVEAISAMTGAIGGIDVLAFTGGVGEHCPAVRQDVVDRLGFLGAGVNSDANADADADADIGTVESSVRTVVVSAGEDIQMAYEARPLLHRDDQ